jgi:phosphatidylserine decarboxylase
MHSPVNIEGLWDIVGAAALAALFYFVGFWEISIPFIMLVLFFLFFFRDPERVVPKKKGIVVSPADGKVLEVSKKSGKKFIHIFLSPMDVHVNRMPLTGKIESVDYSEGRFWPAFMKRASKNEENEILIKAGKKKIILTQVAGFMARRIRCWVKAGDKIDIGKRIGMIKFGSGAKLLLPKEFKVVVKKGDKVKAGETVVAKW